MWDLLILTAMDEGQKLAYEMELRELKIESFRNWIVVMDEPKAAKIGSGGSTFLCLRHLRRRYGKFDALKILVVHSGGFSQRLPIASPLGKAFLTFPNGRSMIEMKLASYEKVEEKLNHGIVICSSDTLEHFAPTFEFAIEDSSEVVLFGHHSKIEVAEQHGVYILDGNDALQRVLQKPSRREMNANGALRNGGDCAITDSFFIIRGQSLIASLLELADSFASEPPKSEICCYGDFLRPLGSEALTDYIASTVDPDLKRWRALLKKTFDSRNVQTIVLPGDETFFHFGTTSEFAEHMSGGSAFATYFRVEANKVSYSRVNRETFQIAPTSSVEYCSIEGGAEISENCFISNIKTAQHSFITIPRNTTIITIPIHSCLFVTVAFETNKNLKETTNKWFGHELGNAAVLWDVKLFKAEETAERSLLTTLNTVGSGKIYTGEYSMRDVLDAKDVKTMVEWRQKLRRFCLQF